MSTVTSGSRHIRVWGRMDGAVHAAGGGPDLPPATLYGLLRLRVDVFVVEQRCAYPELDGRDLDPGTVPLLDGSRRGARACLRLLTEPTGDRRIGRVCTTAAARGRGVARPARRLRRSTRSATPRACSSAQAHLTRLYGGFGFVPNGPGYEWDGVPHVPMRGAEPVGLPSSAGSNAVEDTGHEW